MIASVAQVVACTEAEGPGRRYALWFQGCPLRCPGCCNPEMLPFDGGTSRNVDEIIAEIREAQAQHAIEGISLLGGEPLAHAEPAAEVASAVWQLGLTVMIYSGYTLAEARHMHDPAVDQLLAHCDVLVDGRYDRERPEPQRRWVGSSNQVVHLLTTRYTADDPMWTKPNTLEIRLRGNDLIVNGFPASSAINLWQRLPLQLARHRRD